MGGYVYVDFYIHKNQSFRIKGVIFVKMDALVCSDSYVSSLQYRYYFPTQTWLVFMELQNDEANGYHKRFSFMSSSNFVVKFRSR